MVAWDWSPRQLAALARFLQERGLTCGPVRAVRIGDGHSNLTYRVIDEAGATVVVRRPPPPPTPPGAHDVLREARLISALGGSAVPVAPVLATASAGEVLDVPLYVMGYVDGVVVTAQTPPPLDSPSTRRRIGHALVDMNVVHARLRDRCLPRIGVAPRCLVVMTHKDASLAR